MSDVTAALTDSQWKATLQDEFRAGMTVLPQYLQATEALLQQPLEREPGPEKRFTPATKQRITDQAQAANLDPERLSQWVAIRSRRLRSSAPIVLPEAVVLTPETFIPDGEVYAYVPAGRVAIQANPAAAEIASAGYWQRAAEFRGFQHTPQTQNEGGATGAWHRGGRMLKTPTFTIDSDQIQVRLRGASHVFLSVDSHMLIAGPLHGALLRTEGFKPEWRWVSLNTQNYRGHRAHLEFVPEGDHPCDVGAVSLGNSPPVEVIDSIAGLSASELQSDWEDFVAGKLDAPRVTLTAALIVQNSPLCGVPTETLVGWNEKLTQQTKADRDRWIAKIRLLSATAPAFLVGSRVEEALFVRGNPHKPGPIVPRRFLEVFSSTGGPAASSRIELAEQMVDPQRTPILPRVIVNRIWQHAFGRGIVPTPDDFGQMGLPPTNPELLDFLTQQFIAGGWSIKQLHREILLSATYRMQSVASDAVAELQDPKNELWHRTQMKRLEGEVLRDAILRVAGRLDETLYGPSTPIHLTAHLEGRGRPGASGPIDGQGRRSIYLAVRRNFPEPFLTAFDLPTPTTTRGRRSVSNVPAQALALLNNPLVAEQAQRWESRLHDLPDPAQRLAAMYVAAFGRPPTREETATLQALLSQEAVARNLSVDAAPLWIDVAQALINAKEFMFVP